jgi:transcriptional regulator with XRE-family HTH domain
MTDLPSMIRDLRNRLHLSQEQLAQRLNVSFATVNRWENGRAEPQGSARQALDALIEEIGQGELALRHEDVATETPRRRKRGTSLAKFAEKKTHRNSRITFCRSFSSNVFPMCSKMKFRG